MEIGVHEAALRIGVSDRRARAMLAAGQIPARQLAGRWLVEEANLPRSRALARPMSPRMAWAFIGFLSGEIPRVAPSELSRLRHKREQLLAAAEAPLLLRSWLPRRAERCALSIAPNDLPELCTDFRVLLSGISDARSQLSAAGAAELYVTRRDLEVLRRDYLLSSLGRPNLIAHVVDRPLPPATPLVLVVADLADHDRPREDQRTVELLRAATRSW